MRLPLLLLAALAFPGPARAGPAAPAAPSVLTPQQEAGRTIYETGESPSGGGITATVGGDPAPIPGSVLTCSSCHGEDGLGRPEGTVDPSVITWSELTRPGGHLHGSRRHKTFDTRGVIRAITDGVDQDGQQLDGAMPRYSLSREDMDALLAYLRVLERRLDPGLTPERVRLGTVLPTRGPLAEVGTAMRATLEGAVKELNGAGGLNGRRVVLEVAGYDPARQTPEAAARALQQARPVFAFVSGFAPGAEGPLAAWAEEAKVPWVGPFAPAAPPAGNGHWTFYLHAGPTELSRVLVEHAVARLGLADPAVAVLQEEGDPRLADAARAALRQAGQRGWKRVEVGPLGPPEQARERVAQLASKGVEVVLLLGDDRALEAFLVEAAAASWTPWVLVPGILAARAASTAPAAFEGRLLLGYPSLPSDETEAGGAHLASLSTEVERRHHAARASAASAVAVVGEALRRTGRNLSRARFVASLEALYRLETGLGPPISFGVRRRVGALGGYVVAVDLAKRSFTPASGWIRLD